MCILGRGALQNCPDGACRTTRIHLISSHTLRSSSAESHTIRGPALPPPLSEDATSDFCKAKLSQEFAAPLGGLRGRTVSLHGRVVAEQCLQAVFPGLSLGQGCRNCGTRVQNGKRKDFLSRRQALLSHIFFIPLPHQSLSVVNNIYTHTYDCVQTVYELPLLPNITAV